MKKIMFNDRYGLTQAVLEGRKTMTRRAVPILLQCRAFEKYQDEVERREYAISKAQYKSGEVVAVAQKYKDIPNPFRGRVTDYTDAAGWENKMFVKAELMPYKIRITNVRVERLQDITDDDCLCEGVKLYADKYGSWGYTFTQSIGVQLFTSHRKAFAALIDKVSGKGTWESNPWVFVYEFELA